ncbi:MAG: hypothetical protein KC994_03495 [Candidatus Omnitrophica bacterium]|nr:hypothetical protein [Candidatus Omnitrophota bacterium]
MSRIQSLFILLLCHSILIVGPAFSERKWEFFDQDPGWEGINNRSAALDPQEVVQDFGYCPAEGDQPARIGGRITPAGEPAYYAKAIEPLNLDQPIAASGKLTVAEGGGHFLLGFFNSQTINEWRTPNTLVFRINGRGEFFHPHLEYTTRLWKAQGTVIGRHDIEADRVYPIEAESGTKEYSWSIHYDPKANNGEGAMSGAFEDGKASWDLLPGHREEGATFDRFGLLNVMKSVDGPGHAWISDLVINGQKIDLSEDPKWDCYGNRKTYMTTNIRPRFDFGYSETQYAGGRSSGEIGGLMFRGDCRYPERMAAYGDRIEEVNLEKPLQASGKVSLRMGVSDSTTLFGFYHSEKSMKQNPSQDTGWPEDFLGAAIEGPSSEGFNFYPAYRMEGDNQSRGRGSDPPMIHPDGEFHAWTLDYDPDGAEGKGRITVTLDGHPVTMDFELGQKEAGASFNRFGFVTTWIDGNGQRVFFDDLNYTWKQ